MSDSNKEKIKSVISEITDWSNKTILVAEDMDDSYYVKETMLEYTHAKIIRAKNGTEAVEICRKNSKVDLVLMDMRMPDKSGYEATIEIKKFLPDLPIIAQTAYAISGDKAKAINAGCDDYITKPIKSTTLIEKINSFLSNNK